MNRIDRPALGRAPSHVFAVAAALAIGALVAPLAATPARAGWSSETPVPEVWNTRPAVAMDASGDLGVAWQESSAAAGIRFATDATGDGATEIVSTGDDWSPDLVFGPGDTAHVAFARFGTGAGLYLATRTGGSWIATRLRTDPLPWSPSIAIDGAGKLHVAYASEGFTPGIWYLTNTTGAWVATRVSTGTWDSEPSLALDPSGKVHIAYARYDRPSPGLLIATNATGSWVTTRLTTNIQLDDWPALVIDAAGRRHVAALRGQAPGEEPGSTLLYITDASGTWVASDVPLPAGALGIGLPAIGLDEAGKPEIVARVGSATTTDDTLWRFTDPPGGVPERLVAGAERSEDFPDILRDATGRLVVAHRAGWLAPGVIVHREDPDEDALVAPSVATGFPSLATDGNGARHIAFDRWASDTSDGTSYVSDATGSWEIETVGPTHGPARMAAAGSTTIYRSIAIPDRLYSRSGVEWEVDPFQLATGTEVAITVGGALVAYAAPGAGIRIVEPGGGETALTHYGGDPRDREPAIDRDLELVVAFTRDHDLYAMYKSSTGWHGPTLIDASTSWEPAIATTRNSLGTSHIAYDRHDDDRPGIWLATGGAWLGAWETQRISRSWADSRPAIALDASNSIYVAWHRECWGPSPGIFLATNRTGSWVTTQLVASCDVASPSISIVPGGHVVVAYLAPGRGISVVTELSATTADAVRAVSAAPGRSSRAAADLEATDRLVGGASEFEPAGTSPQTTTPEPPAVSRSQLAQRFAGDR